MIVRTLRDTIALHDTEATDRDRIVRLCARLTGDPDAAEDLAQEALLIAWSQQHQLRDPEKRARWMLGIARNLSMNWNRRQGREAAFAARPDEDDAAPDLESVAGQVLGPEVELERHELADLLDRALALLPPDTRDVLVERYVEESPHSEIARKLGLSESALKVRLHRGRLALRRVIEHDLSDEAVSFGLITADAQGWQDTRIWCPICGQNTWKIRFVPESDTVSFRCPVCTPGPDERLSEYRRANASFSRLIGGLTQPRAILNRTAVWANEYFRRVLRERSAICTNCGRPAQLFVSIHEDTRLLLEDPYVLLVICEACGEGSNCSFGGLVKNLPEVQSFWRKHSRVRSLPAREVEVGGRPALVTPLESVTGASRLDVVSARDNLDVIGIHGDLV